MPPLATSRFMARRARSCGRPFRRDGIRRRLTGRRRMIRPLFGRRSSRLTVVLVPAVLAGALLGINRCL
jgi:hypothetical protein